MIDYVGMVFKDVHYNCGRIVLAAGQETKGVYIIRNGRLQLQKEIHYVDSMKLIQKKRVVMLDVNEGDIFGEECLNQFEEQNQDNKSKSE